jgi:hypothetical protein
MALGLEQKDDKDADGYWSHYGFEESHAEQLREEALRRIAKPENPPIGSISPSLLFSDPPVHNGGYDIWRAEGLAVAPQSPRTVMHRPRVGSAVSDTVVAGEAITSASGPRSLARTPAPFVAAASDVNDAANGTRGERQNDVVVNDEDYWGAESWDPDERVYIGADIGQTNHLKAFTPKKDSLHATWSKSAVEKVGCTPQVQLPPPGRDLPTYGLSPVSSPRRDTAPKSATPLAAQKNCRKLPPAPPPRVDRCDSDGSCDSYWGAY